VAIDPEFAAFRFRQAVQDLGLPADELGDDQVRDLLALEWVIWRRSSALRARLQIHMRIPARSFTSMLTACQRAIPEMHSITWGPPIRRLTCDACYRAWKRRVKWALRRSREARLR
jgi:hypothetical protein